MAKTASWVVNHGDLCTAEEPVPCTLQCPLRLDVRTTLSRLAKGDLEGARMQIEEDIPFPKIVCRLCPEPCREACKREGLGGSIHLRDLERACLELTEEPQRRRYARRPKKGRILVVGGGIAAMTCAYVLGRKGYTVELRASDEVLGGRLRALSEDVLGRDVIDEAAALVASNASVLLGSPVDDLDALEWDACLVATGAGDPNLGLKMDGSLLHMDPVSRQTSRPDVFAAGAVVGQNDIASAIAGAISALWSIERLLRGGSLTIERDDQRDGCSRLFVDTEGVEAVPEIPTPDGGYTREEAVAEAQRCLLCECDRCVRTCDLMSRDRRKPARCINDLAETFSAVAKHSAKIALRKSNMCLQCNLCGTRCPNGLDMGVLYLETRRILRGRGELPPAFHDFWLRDMAHALSNAATCTVVPEGAGTVDYLYFPGCSLGASDPSLVTGAYELLQDTLPGSRVGLDTGCCGAPAQWAGDEALFDAVGAQFVERWSRLGSPTIVTSCPTCRKMLSAGNPDLPVTSYWEVLAETGAPLPAHRGNGTDISLFDPCSSRLDLKARAAVRTLLTGMGYAIEEMEGDASKARCCGFGGLIYAVDQDFARSVADARIGSASHHIVTYCSNCRDVFRSQGAEAIHLLDLLLGHDKPAPLPSLGMRRTNREELRARLTGQPTPAVAQGPELVLDEGVLEKLNAQLLLIDEVREVIACSLETGEQLADPDTGRLVAHLQVGIITIWAVFEPEGDAFRVHNVYSHRMTIAE